MACSRNNRHDREKESLTLYSEYNMGVKDKAFHIDNQIPEAAILVNVNWPVWVRVRGWWWETANLGEVLLPRG